MTFNLTRSKQTTKMRQFFNKYQLTRHDFIYPVFITSSNNIELIESMPGVLRYPLNELDRLISQLNNAQITTILLFGVPNSKSRTGDIAKTEANPVIQALAYFRERAPHITLMADLCLCAYTENGQCSIVENNQYNFAKSEDLLAEIAITYAKAGADIIAPSCVFDNHVKKIRQNLDKNNFFNVIIVDYAIKFASNYYGPFRDAADSAPTYGDRKAYQLNFTKDEYLIKARASIAQQSDALIVKPGLPYLDVIHELSNELEQTPLFAYHVSGEYTSLKLMQQYNYVNYEQALIETIVSFKRAGATKIITYAALELGHLCQQNGGVICI